MNKVVISHPLYKDGMALLEGKVELVIPNDGDSDRILDSLIDADAFILRIGKIDRRAIEQCPKLKVITRQQEQLQSRLRTRGSGPVAG